MKFNDREKVIRPEKLYRNLRQAKCMGVCAGMADFFNTDRHLVRILVILSAIFFTTATIIVYVVAGLVLPRRPDWSYH